MKYENGTNTYISVSRPFSLNITEMKSHGQGPRNLYGRDSKFRATFKSGTEKL